MILDGKLLTRMYYMPIYYVPCAHRIILYRGRIHCFATTRSNAESDILSKKYLSELQNVTRFKKIGPKMPNLQPFTFREIFVAHPVQ